jgi:RimJ/RimL family protein N-acetyltransferase
VIRGKQISLSELRLDDADTLFLWINDPETVRFNAPYTPVHENGHRAWFEKVTRDATRVVFGIRARKDQRLIGLLQLADIHPVHRSTELIIRIGEETNRNRGAGSEAVQLGVQFAFRDRNLQRVWLRVFAGNHRAIRAYAKAGLQVEGTLRRACYVNGEWRDEVIMAVIADVATDGRA